MSFDILLLLFKLLVLTVANLLLPLIPELMRLLLLALSLTVVPLASMLGRVYLFIFSFTLTLFTFSFCIYGSFFLLLIWLILNLG